MSRKWSLFPVILKRRSDNSLWTPLGDIPFPIRGFNFVSVKKARIGWWLDVDDRWLFEDPYLFDFFKK